MPPQHPSPHPNIQNAWRKLKGRGGGSYHFADLKKKLPLSWKSGILRIKCISQISKIFTSKLELSWVSSVETGCKFGKLKTCMILFSVNLVENLWFQNSGWKKIVKLASTWRGALPHILVGIKIFLEKFHLSKKGRLEKFPSGDCLHSS